MATNGCQIVNGMPRRNLGSAKVHPLDRSSSSAPYISLQLMKSFYWIIPSFILLCGIEL